MMKQRTLAFGLAVATALAAGSASAANVKHGEEVFQAKCSACHAIKPGVVRLGPSLSGVFDREAGAVKGYHYKGLTNAKFKWDEQKLMAYLKDPLGFVKTLGASSTMMVVKLPGKEDRQDVIAYLKTLK